MSDVACFMVERVDVKRDDHGTDWFKLRRTDTGEVLDGGYTTGLYRAPAGAMMVVRHLPNSHHRPGSVKGGTEDHLLVVTPGGIWCVDCPATGGGGKWTREGDPPNVTANPSIRSGDSYHGWLRAGVLVGD